MAAVIGGAFAVGYLAFQNFRAIGQHSKAKWVLFGFIIGGVIALWVAWHTPPDFLSFQLSVGIPQLVVALLAASLLHGTLLSAHREAGGAFRSKWFAFGIGVFSNLAIKALFYALSSVLAQTAVS